MTDSSSNQPITLQRISPETVSIFKAVRLSALQDTPTAFGSTFAREAQLSDAEWLQRSKRWTTDHAIGYLAFDGDAACGIVAAFRDEEEPHRACVVSMWVDPSWRRSGVGRALIHALRDWAVTCGHSALALMVTSVNTSAIRFYERIGFQMSGRTEPYPNDPDILEYEMILTLPGETTTRI
jgi:GNAT superfamily N-acetyltransferase